MAIKVEKLAGRLIRLSCDGCGASLVTVAPDSVRRLRAGVRRRHVCTAVAA